MSIGEVGGVLFLSILGGCAIVALIVVLLAWWENRKWERAARQFSDDGE